MTQNVPAHQGWPPPIGIISQTYARPFLHEHAALFSHMAEAGVEFCELIVPEPQDGVDPVRLGDHAKAAGLSLELAARVTPDRDMTSSSDSVHQAAVSYLEQCCAFARDCGARIIGGPIYGSPLIFAGRPPSLVSEAEREARIARAVTGLRQAGDAAAAKEVRIAVEPVNRFETDFCNLSRQAVELVTKVGHPAVGMMLDTFHMNMEENDLPQAVRHAGKHLVHFQANENHRGFLGTGHIDWPPICRALAEIGYSGRISLEPFRRTDDRLSVPLARWRPPTFDETADITASVHFLRAALHAASKKPLQDQA